MPFSHAPVGGQGNIVVTQIRSPNYVPGVSGWSIRKDGSSEFNDLEIRGTFSGTDFILNPSGLFFYSGTPAFGNLIGSWASSAGTDQFGNVYDQGICLGLTSNTEIQLRPDLDAILIYAE